MSSQKTYEYSEEKYNKIVVLYKQNINDKDFLNYFFNSEYSESDITIQISDTDNNKDFCITDFIYKKQSKNTNHECQYLLVNWISDRNKYDMKNKGQLTDD